MGEQLTSACRRRVIAEKWKGSGALRRIARLIEYAEYR
jgi:hypothetical protein